jgi:hypothetical protein
MTAGKTPSVFLLFCRLLKSYAEIRIVRGNQDRTRHHTENCINKVCKLFLEDNVGRIRN